MANLVTPGTAGVLVREVGVLTSGAMMAVIAMNDPSVIFPTKLSARGALSKHLTKANKWKIIAKRPRTYIQSIFFVLRLSLQWQDGGPYKSLPCFQ